MFTHAKRDVVSAVWLFGLSWISLPAIAGVHEAGHVLAAWATGGRVLAISVDPFLAQSFVDIRPDPSPRITYAGGVVAVMAVGLMAWMAAYRAAGEAAVALRGFTAYALASSGLYLGVGALLGSGDAADLAGLGIPKWQLVVGGSTLIVLSIAAARSTFIRILPVRPLIRRIAISCAGVLPYLAVCGLASQPSSELVGWLLGAAAALFAICLGSTSESNEPIVVTTHRALRFVAGGSLLVGCQMRWCS